MARVVVVGAAGQAKVVIDALERAGEHTIVGLVDSFKPVSTPCYGYEVLGTELELADLCERLSIDGGIVAVGDNAARVRLADDITRRVPGFRFVNAIHPSAQVARGVELGSGVLLAAGAVVNPEAVIADHVAVWTSASVDHDSRVDRGASLAPRAATGGGVQIGAHTAIGLGASLIHGVRIGPHTVVGAGAVVVRDLPSHVVAFGNPARVVRARAEGDPYL